eukprot:CAMPEP_0194496340 /NCGR_PEP_ID=MMETSP0253-20130528/13648_1 /TAXON_ID=2966 /ORGANISM="Noctiluca scintillans" /LENGTH=188 /DNA_ID=CAMNT_0039337731 /DNA_START=60 /DNA_END=627 /DNA_ORIENTATION=+
MKHSCLANLLRLLAGLHGIQKELTLRRVAARLRALVQLILLELAPPRRSSGGRCALMTVYHLVARGPMTASTARLATAMPVPMAMPDAMEPMSPDIMPPPAGAATGAAAGAACTGGGACCAAGAAAAAGAGAAAGAAAGVVRGGAVRPYEGPAPAFGAGLLAAGDGADLLPPRGIAAIRSSDNLARAA